MKKVFCLLCCFVCLFSFLGCERSTDVVASYISENTSAGSDNYGVKIVYADDSRLHGKYIDTQIKFAKKGEIVIWAEGGKKFAYVIDDYDEGYSLTMIFAEQAGKAGEETFEKFDEAVAKFYFFNSPQSQEVTLRVVAGDVVLNDSQMGEILSETDPISDQFTLKIKKN